MKDGQSDGLLGDFPICGLSVRNAPILPVLSLLMSRSTRDLPRLEALRLLLGGISNAHYEIIPALQDACNLRIPVKAISVPEGRRSRFL